MSRKNNLWRLILKPSGVLLMMSFVLLVACKSGAEQDGGYPLKTVALINPDTSEKVLFIAEHAHTPATRKQGLKYRHSLPQNSAMLFTWPEKTPPHMPASTGFWMKDTHIQLAIIFAYQGTVTYVHKNAIPHDLTTILPPANAKPTTQVLEINAAHPVAQKVAPGWTLFVHEK